MAIISKAAATPPPPASLPCPDRFFASFPIRYSPSSPLHFSPYRGRLRLRDCAAAAAAGAAALAGVGKCLWKPAILHGPPVVAHRWFARFHSLVQRTLGSMMKLNWGNFARHRESWLAMMMMISMMMMMMMAAINSVIHKHQQQQQLACSVGRLVAAPPSCCSPARPGLKSNPRPAEPQLRLGLQFQFFFPRFWAKRKRM